MATDDVKKENLLRMSALSLEVLATEVWDTLGESAIVLSRGMGDAILEMLEKEEGLEIAGESPEDVGKEISRIFVDEFGFAKEISLTVDADRVGIIKVGGCINTKFTDKMLASGLTMNYVCPVMMAAGAAMRQMGMKGRVKIDRWAEGKGCKISFIPA
jgi:hypothetical protein